MVPEPPKAITLIERHHRPPARRRRPRRSWARPPGCAGPAPEPRPPWRTPPDRIELRGLRLIGLVGVLPEERDARPAPGGRPRRRGRPVARRAVRRAGATPSTTAPCATLVEAVVVTRRPAAARAPGRGAGRGGARRRRPRSSAVERGGAQAAPAGAPGPGHLRGADRRRGGSVPRRDVVTASRPVRLRPPGQGGPGAHLPVAGLQPGRPPGPPAPGRRLAARRGGGVAAVRDRPGGRARPGRLPEPGGPSSTPTLDPPPAARRVPPHRGQRRAGARGALGAPHAGHRHHLDRRRRPWTTSG